MDGAALGTELVYVLPRMAVPRIASTLLPSTSAPTRSSTYMSRAPDCRQCAPAAKTTTTPASSCGFLPSQTASTVSTAPVRR